MDSTGGSKADRMLPGRSRAERIALASLGGLFLTWCVASIGFPFAWDHGIMSSVGDAIVRGGMPYRDAWDMKGPLAFYVFAAAQWTFGRHMWAIRLLDVFLLLAACAALSSIVSRVASSRTGIWSAIAFALWYASLTWFFLSQPDGWVALLMVLGVAPLVSHPDRFRFRDAGWCGFLVGCCALIKPFYLAFVLVPVVFVLAARQPVSRRVAAAAAACATAALPALLTLAVFAYRGALGSLIEVHFRYARAYAGSLSPRAIIGQFYRYFFVGGEGWPVGIVAVVLPAIGFGAYALWRERRQLGLMFVTWLGVALFCVIIQVRFWVYHWVPTFPPFVVLGVAGLSRLAESGSDRFSPRRMFAFVSAALFVIQAASTPAADVARWLKFMSGTLTRAGYYSQFGMDEYVAFDEMEAAGYIRERTRDSDTVAVWGDDATITFLSGRPNPTRFVFAMPLTRGGATSMLRAYRLEYIAGLRNRPPRYFVVGQPHNSSDKDAVLRSFPDLASFVQDRYRLERRFGFLDLYRLAD